MNDEAAIEAAEADGPQRATTAGLIGVVSRTQSQLPRN